MTLSAETIAECRAIAAVAGHSDVCETQCDDDARCDCSVGQLATAVNGLADEIARLHTALASALVIAQEAYDYASDYHHAKYLEDEIAKLREVLAP